MAATATRSAPPFLFSLFDPNPIKMAMVSSSRKTRRGKLGNQQQARLWGVYATAGEYGEAKAGGNRRKRAPPGVDTRIHWENEDEGWVGTSNSSSSSSSSSAAEEKQQLNSDSEPANLLGQKFEELLNESSNSHYQFLGVPATADLEEIKSAYRRLSKEYHPDTTSLPLKAASEKFMKLREIYDVLSNDETRQFYDWTLAQEAASRQAEKMRVKLKDPYVEDVNNYVPLPDMVDRLGGKNMDLSDQAMSALTFDLFVILFCIACFIYAVFFKEY